LHHQAGRPLPFTPQANSRPSAVEIASPGKSSGRHFAKNSNGRSLTGRFDRADCNWTACEAVSPVKRDYGLALCDAVALDAARQTPE
jgi:hypothetical protein